ncbi:uncharacterized protein [Palaemon carinicauda]|uniref:uncharacterized protein n=1 Tax=Palaemon carinicauda TaxID=392227 RepID=UPI0035B65BC8
MCRSSDKATHHPPLACTSTNNIYCISSYCHPLAAVFLLQLQIRGCFKEKLQGLSEVKKRVSGPLLMAVASRVSKLFFLHDAGTGVHFLVDIGACHFLLLRALFRSRHILSKTADVRLVAANEFAISTYSCGNLKLPFGNGKLNWKFLVSDVPLLILGADILSHFNLLVDVAHRRLVNVNSYWSTPLQPAPFNLALHISDPQMPKPTSSHHNRKFSVQNYTKRPRLLPNTAPEHVNRTLYLHCPKYRRHDLLSARSEGFLHAYLLKGYYQVSMNSKDIPKTFIITPFGNYFFNYSYFGIRYAGATFPHLMDGILGDLLFCACYVDDLLAFSSSEEEHLRHLRIVVDILQQNGLVVRGTNFTSQLWTSLVNLVGIHPISDTCLKPRCQ